MTKDEITEVVKLAIAEQQQGFHVEAETHYKHHLQLEVCRESKPEWEANHQFVSDIRRNGEMAKSVLVKLLATAIFGFVITAIFKTLK